MVAPNTANLPPRPTVPSKNTAMAVLIAGVDFFKSIGRRIWRALPSVAQWIQRVNDRLAGWLHLPVQWMLKAEVAGLLGIGATMIQLTEYALAVMCWIVLTVIWISKAIASKRNTLPKTSSVLLALATCTVLIAWTDIKRDDQDWSNLQKFWPSNNLKVLTVVNNKEFESGTVIEGILWSSSYTQLFVILNNPGDASIEDVNVVIRPDYPVARFTQVSNLPDVSFEDKMGLNLSLTIEEQPNPGAPFGPASVYTILAQSVGYRVHCGRIPPASSLRLVMALVDIPKASKTIEYKPGMLLPPVDKADVTGELSYGTEGSYWYALRGIRNYFGARPNPKWLRVEGSYIADNKRRRIKQKVPL